MTTLEMILKSGKIENEDQAEVFVGNARFEYAENGWGDYRIELDGVNAEIYAVLQGDGEFKEEVVDPIPQVIRFYNKETCNQIENPFK